MIKRRPIRLVLLPGLSDDFRALHDMAERDPRGTGHRLLRVALNEVELIAQGKPGKHRLDYMPTYPDISDCWTTYIRADPNRKPSHRLVWRERVPERPDRPIIREAIALGERDAGQVYYLAGQRLGRPVGLTLAELRTQREPIANPQHAQQRSADLPELSRADPGIELT